MSYKSILTIWDGKDSTLASFKKAISMTSEACGHLHIICPVYITVLQTLSYPFTGLPLNLEAEERDRAEKKAAILATEAEKIAKDGLIYYLSLIHI